MSRPRAAGFSLIELIVSIVILGILAAATAPIFSSSLRAYVDSDMHLATLSKARYATERIARELREVQYVTGSGYAFTAPLAATSMTFTKQDPVTLATTRVTIAAAGTSLNLGYAPPGVTAPLTDELSAVNFVYRDALGVAGATAATVASIDVTLTLSNRGVTHTQRVRVALRNNP
jgi:prepilin-type N-terminal cleavage/methylation domain-containing protein